MTIAPALDARTELRRRIRRERTWRTRWRNVRGLVHGTGEPEQAIGANPGKALEQLVSLPGHEDMSDVGSDGIVAWDWIRGKMW